MVPSDTLLAAHLKAHMHTSTFAWRQLLQIAHMADVLPDGVSDITCG